KALEWVMPWKKALNEDGVLFIEQLAHEFSQDDKGETTFSSGFFYKIQERFDLLNPPTKIVVKKPTHKFKVKTKKTAILTPEQAITLLAVDYMASGDNQKITLEQAKEKITLLLTQCRSVTRILNDNNKERFSEPSEHLKADGAFLVRFLATKGM
ncbi:MAG: hypothetical protein KAH77_08585, partial [Thiomargarita sp.]|nr:hypothetical protein [Thiomargarita sp.]